MAALVVNLIVLAGFVMNNWYQEAQKTQDQGLTKVSADVADRHYVMPVGMPPHFLNRFQISTLYAAVCSSFKSRWNSSM